MPKIRSVADIQKKWATVTPARSADFEAGIRAPKESWVDKTSGAESAYEEGVSAAIGRKAFGKGVKEAGNAKWSSKTLLVGVPRWGGGVRAAEADYGKGFGPYRAVIEGTVLPPRGPKGSPANIDRVRVMAAALHDAKIKAA